MPGRESSPTSIIIDDNRIHGDVKRGEVPEAYFGMEYFQEGVDADLDANTVWRSC